MTPKQIAEAIQANSRAVDNNKIEWDEFSANQRALWAQVDMGEMRVIGSDCDRRMQEVEKHLK